MAKTEVATWKRPARPRTAMVGRRPAWCSAHWACSPRSGPTGWSCPGIVFGIAAIVLGIRARRRSSREAGSVAIALGIVALLLVPSVLFIVDAAEDWGRDCALNPSNPDC